MNIQKLIYSLSLLAGLFMMSAGASEPEYIMERDEDGTVSFVKNPNYKKKGAASSDEDIDIQESKKSTSTPKSNTGGWFSGWLGSTPKSSKKETIGSEWQNVLSDEEKEERENEKIAKLPKAEQEKAIEARNKAREKEAEALQRIENTQNPTLGRKALETGKSALNAIGENEIVKEVKQEFVNEAKSQGSTIAKAAAGAAGVLTAGALAALAAKANDLIDWFKGSKNEENEQKQAASTQPANGVAQLINITSAEIKAVIRQLNATSLDDIKVKNDAAVTSFNSAITAGNWSNAQRAIDVLKRSVTSINNTVNTVLELNSDIKSVKKVAPDNVAFNTLVAELNDTIKDMFNPSEAQELLNKTKADITNFENKLNQAKQQPIAPKTSAVKPVINNTEDIERIGEEVDNTEAA